MVSCDGLSPVYMIFSPYSHHFLLQSIINKRFSSISYCSSLCAPLAIHSCIVRTVITHWHHHVRVVCVHFRTRRDQVLFAEISHTLWQVDVIALTETITWCMYDKSLPNIKSQCTPKSAFYIRYPIFLPPLILCCENENLLLVQDCNTSRFHSLFGEIRAQIILSHCNQQIKVVVNPQTDFDCLKIQRSRISHSQYHSNWTAEALECNVKRR